VKEVMNQVEGKWIAWKMDSMEVMSFYSKIIPADETQEQVTADGSPTVALRTELFHREAFIRKKNHHGAPMKAKGSVDALFERSKVWNNNLHSLQHVAYNKVIGD
jgi:hypothetical protein